MRFIDHWLDGSRWLTLWYWDRLGWYWYAVWYVSLHHWSFIKHNIMNNHIIMISLLFFLKNKANDSIKVHCNLCVILIILLSAFSPKCNLVWSIHVGKFANQKKMLHKLNCKGILKSYKVYDSWSCLFLKLSRLRKIRRSEY